MIPATRQRDACSRPTPRIPALTATRATARRPAWRTGSARAALSLTCNDSNPCTDDSCNPATGCVFTNDNTNSCADGNACNGIETCVSGVCQSGTPLVCNDSNPCTDDSCDQATGCVFTNDNTNSCVDSDLCNGTEVCAGGACQNGTPLDCDDGEVCTLDGCDAQLGCTHDPVAGACDDQDACTVNDFCDQGACVGGGAADCNDNNFCTDDGCDPQTGCTHTNNSLGCDDGNACTIGDVCNGGSCVGGGAANCNDNNVCTDDAAIRRLAARTSPTTMSATTAIPARETIDARAGPASGTRSPIARPARRIPTATTVTSATAPKPASAMCARRAHRWRATTPTLAPTTSASRRPAVFFPLTRTRATMERVHHQ